MAEIKEMPSLGSVYDSIKAGAVGAPILSKPDIDFQIRKNADCLRDNCHRHFILDIYCKILPLDKDFISGNMGMMKNDVDMMLKSKGMTPTQYMTACSESVSGESVYKYLVNVVDDICKQYTEDAKNTVDEAKEKGMDVPVPEPPEDPTEDAEINSQLVDAEDDVSYDTFVDALKKKTIDRIVADVTKIINDQAESDDLSFNPKAAGDVQPETEATAYVGVIHLRDMLNKKGIDTKPLTESIIGYATREATINQMDLAANLPHSSFQEFSSKIRFGKGVLINESAVEALAEECEKKDVKKVIDDANKERDEKINSELKASDVVNDDKEEEKN